MKPTRNIFAEIAKSTVPVKIPRRMNRPRTTENTAFSNGHFQYLNRIVPLEPIHLQVLEADNQRRHLNKQGGKRIYGGAQWSYIAGQTGLGRKEARRVFFEADRRITLMVYHGLDAPFQYDD